MSEEQERELPFDPSAVQPTPEAITIVSRFNRRVLVPGLGEYRDVGRASAPISILRIDATDPAYAFMKAWAEREPDVRIDDMRPPQYVCPICQQPSPDAAALAEHARLHWDDGNENGDAVDPAKPPRAARKKE